MADEKTEASVVCPDCGRPRAGEVTGLIHTHCFAGPSGDWLGKSMCRNNTITKLRAEVEALRARVAELDLSERRMAEAYQHEFNAHQRTLESRK